MTTARLLLWVYMKRCDNTYLHVACSLCRQTSVHGFLHHWAEVLCACSVPGQVGEVVGGLDARVACTHARAFTLSSRTLDTVKRTVPFVPFALRLLLCQ